MFSATDANGSDMFANMTKEGRAHEQEFQDKFTQKMKDARVCNAECLRLVALCH